MVITLLSSGFLIYFFAAVTPAVILMHYIYRMDKVEKEPGGLLIRCIVGGIFSALLAIVLEEIGEGLLSLLIGTTSPFFVVFSAFLVVAVAEEFAKFLFLKRATWRNPNFNFRFDGVVYAVFVSLGFAAFENVSYVLGYGLSIAPARALLAVPAHMSFAVFMGVFYGRARLLANEGEMAAARRSNFTGVLIAVLMHGFYDACAMTESRLSALLFIAFVIIMDIVVFLTVRRESRTDEPI